MLSKPFRYSLILLIIIGFFFGCKSFKSGTYQIYQIEPNEHFGQKPLGYDDSLYNAMKNQLIGVKFLINYKDKFVTIKNLKRGTEAILAREVNQEGIETYIQTEKRGTSIITTSLKKGDDGNLICLILLSLPRAKVPTGESAIFTSSEKRALAVCYLGNISE